MLDPGGQASVCAFDNTCLTAAVRSALVKLGLPVVGQHVDLLGPGPVVIVRIIRDPASAHPRAAVFVTYEAEADIRHVAVASYRADGTVNRSIAIPISATDWDDGEPEALPIAQRGGGQWGRRPLAAR